MHHLSKHESDAHAEIEMLRAEIAAIVDACGFEYDSDPDAPRTLVGYVREVHGMAVDQAEHVTSDHIDAAVRRLSINSRHMRARLARLAAAEDGGA